MGLSNSSDRAASFRIWGPNCGPKSIRLQNKQPRNRNKNLYVVKTLPMLFQKKKCDRVEWTGSSILTRKKFRQGWTNSRILRVINLAIQPSPSSGWPIGPCWLDFLSSLLESTIRLARPIFNHRLIGPNLSKSTNTLLAQLVTTLLIGPHLVNLVPQLMQFVKACF